VRETLFLRLRDLGPDAEIAYVTTVAESAAGFVARQASLSQIASMATGRRIVAFAPATDVRLSKVTVPARQAAKVLQAAPFQLEGQFAEDVETLQFAIGARQADGSHPVAVIARTRLDGWLEQLRGAGIEPHVVAPEMLALPWRDDGSWFALAETDQVTVRTGAYSGFNAGLDDFELMLQLADAGGEPHPLHMLVTKAVSRDFTKMQRRVELLPGFNHPLEALARHYRVDSSINLLQGEYAKGESWQRYWQPWRLAAGFALAVFLGGVALNGVEAFRLYRAAVTQEAQNETQFSVVFPSEKPTAYLADQINSLVRRAQGGSANGLFVLTQRFAEAQTATPGLTLKSCQFHDGALYLDLTGGDLQLLEHIRDWFAQHPGVKLEVLSADSGANGVQIRLKLSVA
jgi:general secretion pathway protein L